MKSRFATILSCLLAVVTLVYGVAGVAAQGSSSGNVSVHVVPSGEVGVLWASISSVVPGEYEYSPTDSYTANGIIAIGVGDLRGTASGWEVTLSGTPLEGDTNSIAVSNLRLSAGTVESTSPNLAPGSALPRSMPLNPMATSPQPAMFAEPGVGTGTFTNWRQATLTIPSGTSIVNYQSTITVTITGADPRPGD